MGNDYFLNAGIPPAHFEPSSSSSEILNWPSQSPAVEIHQQTHQNFFWEKSKEQSIFDSALSSLGASPAASNSNVSGAGESFMIRELLGKLGNIGNASSSGGDIFDGNGFRTPMSSPPAKNINSPISTKTMPLADFSGDLGFAERAARFSSLGTRSFNERSSQFANNSSNGNEKINGFTYGGNGKLPRVSTSPSLQAFGSQLGGDSGLKVPGELSRKRKYPSKGKSKENSSAPVSPSQNSVKGNDSNEDSDSKRRKPEEGSKKKEDCSVKAEEDTKRKTPEPPKDYIHVRARRGQATDSHSLAERLRREKISERMKLLQDLVPGCNKVTAKALMLDEIINYVQSLQRQVEFLSMKLASVNTRLDLNVDSLMSKDIIQSKNSMQHPVYQMASLGQPYLGHEQNMNVSSNGTIPQCTVDPFDTSVLSRGFNSHLLQLSQFADSAPQFPVFCENDLQTIVQMGFGHNPNRESQTSSLQPSESNL